MTDRAGTPPEPAAAAPAEPAPDAGPVPAPADAAPEPDTGPELDTGPEPGSPGPDDGHPWSEADRPRGLDAWFAPGGEDDAPPERIADERRLVRLLAIMLAALIGIPLLLTVIAFAIELTTGRGG